MNDTKSKTQLAVIGAGPGGYPAAFHAADLGMAVTLIDPEPNPGGVCLYRGCIPSKALLHTTGIKRQAMAASRSGLTFSDIQIDLEKLRASKQATVEKLTGGLGQLCKQRHIRYIRGRARFADTHTLTISTSDGRKETLSSEHTIIATGSRPQTFPGLIDSPLVMTSREALELDDIPDRLLVIGGGYIGLELGQVYAALGSQVSVAEMTPQLLPDADHDLVSVLARQLRNDFNEVLLNTRVAGMTEDDGEIRVALDGAGSNNVEKTFDKVLVAVGRRPNSENLGLENTNVNVDPSGFVKVDGQRRSAESSIFAVGDITGQPMLAHKATAEARVAVEAIDGTASAFNPKAIPAVVFTHPEIAWCGLTRSAARAAGRDVKVARFPWLASGRATTMNITNGFTRLLADPADGQILGVAMVGSGAGELIAEATLAIETSTTADELARVIHPHPTLSETLKEAAEVAVGRCLHFYAG